MKQEDVLENGIGAGDEVFMAGLFTKHSGTSKNMPIVRMGNVAMMPRDAVETKYGDMETYLIEARSIGGMSGSPVFVCKADVIGEPGRMWLMGLIHGHWQLRDEGSADTVIEDLTSNGPINMGIAIVVPAQKIWETLHCETFTKIRQNEDEQARRENYPTAD